MRIDYYYIVRKDYKTTTSTCNAHALQKDPGWEETKPSRAAVRGTLRDEVKVNLNVPYHGTVGARPASTGAVLSLPAVRNPTRGGAGKKRGAPTTSWGAMAGQTRLSAGATQAGGQTRGLPTAPVPRGTRRRYGHVQAALRPGDASIHRSLRAPLVLRRDGDPCRSRRVPAPRDKTTLEIDGCSSRERKYREEGLVRGSLQLSAVAA